jgi:hypothetical protein
MSVRVYRHIIAAATTTARALWGCVADIPATHTKNVRMMVAAPRTASRTYDTQKNSPIYIIFLPYEISFLTALPV